MDKTRVTTIRPTALDIAIHKAYNANMVLSGVEPIYMHTLTRSTKEPEQTRITLKKNRYTRE